jgi:hypothetical protein
VADAVYLGLHFTLAKVRDDATRIIIDQYIRRLGMR